MHNLTFRGSADRRILALTIDDFPSSGMDEPGHGSMALLDLLQELQIPATFFCIGERVRQHRGMAARAIAEGHELGNHMERDQWSLFLSDQQFHAQLDATAKAIRADLEANGRSVVPLRWFRPSGGWPTPQMLGWAAGRGYRTVLGSIWPFDGIPIPLLPPDIRLRLQECLIKRLAHPGGIIVMHDTLAFNRLTRETLSVVVPALKAQSYAFTTITDLVATSP